MSSEMAAVVLALKAKAIKSVAKKLRIAKGTPLLKKLCHNEQAPVLDHSEMQALSKAQFNKRKPSLRITKTLWWTKRLQWSYPFPVQFLRAVPFPKKKELKNVLKWSIQVKNILTESLSLKTGPKVKCSPSNGTSTAAGISETSKKCMAASSLKVWLRLICSLRRNSTDLSTMMMKCSTSTTSISSKKYHHYNPNSSQKLSPWSKSKTQSWKKFNNWRTITTIQLNRLPNKISSHQLMVLLARPHPALFRHHIRLSIIILWNSWNSSLNTKSFWTRA